jgi:hypothetical protein
MYLCSRNVVIEFLSGFCAQSMIGYKLVFRKGSAVAHHIHPDVRDNQVLGGGVLEGQVLWLMWATEYMRWQNQWKNEHCKLKKN